MIVMNRLRVSFSAEKKIKLGIQLLSSKDFPHIRLTDQMVYLYSQADSFLGTAYLSKQNKGVGWLLSSKKVTLDQAYFVELFQKAKEKREALANSDLTTAYRLFNQDGDFFGGMTVDRYGQFALFSWYNAFVYQLRDQITAAFCQVYPEFFGGL